MASESKPMDIEEEVEEIDQEIKKPEEGQVAERELNYQRKPRAEDLKAPDIFRGMRSQILPVLQAYNTPTGMKDNPKGIKALPKPKPKAPKGSQAAFLEDNPDTKNLDMFKSELIKFMDRIKGDFGRVSERQERLNERGTQFGGQGSGKHSQATRNRNEKLQHEKEHRYDEKPEPKKRPPMSAEALERRRLNFEKPKTRKHTDLTRRKYRTQSFTNSLLELNNKLKRGGESIGSDSKQSGKAPFKGGIHTADRKVNRLSAGEHKKLQYDKEGNLIPDRSTTASTGKKDKPVTGGANFRAGKRTRVGGAMGGLKIGETKPVVTASSRTGGAGAPKIGDRTPSQTRRGQQRAAQRGIKLNVVNQSQDDFENPEDPVGVGHGRKMPELGADLSDKKIGTNKPAMSTKKPAKRTGLGTSGLGSGVGSPIAQSNNREWFSEVYGI